MGFYHHFIVKNCCQPLVGVLAKSVFQGVTMVFLKHRQGPSMSYHSTVSTPCRLGDDQWGWSRWGGRDMRIIFSEEESFLKVCWQPTLKEPYSHFGDGHLQGGAGLQITFYPHGSTPGFSKKHFGQKLLSATICNGVFTPFCQN
jgi:hypothetical protein